MRGDIPTPAQQTCAMCGAPMYYHEPTDTWACSSIGPHKLEKELWDLATFAVLTMPMEPPSVTALRERVRVKTAMWEQRLTPVFEQILALDSD